MKHTKTRMHVTQIKDLKLGQCFKIVYGASCCTWLCREEGFQRINACYRHKTYLGKVYRDRNTENVIVGVVGS
jgi:hypothetical protein